MTKKEIALNGYNKLLSELRNYITETQNNVVKIVTRQKVEMAWKIGKSISLHLSENNQSGYGEKLFGKLEVDIGITQSVLYKMRNFYKSYPKIPQDNKVLNWSHYRVLSGVKKDDERKYLEDLVKEHGWNSDDLQLEVKKSKISQIQENQKVKQIANQQNKTQKNKTFPKLYPKRGRLFCYNLTSLNEGKKTYIDCGFNIFREVEESLQSNLLKQLKSGDQIVETTKKNDEYSFEKLETGQRKINIYKAYLERVFDGDTLHVILDLGFKIQHREILRLRGVNAPESKMQEGRKSSAALKHILKKVPFLVIKTTATDIYGRYIADVFLAGVGEGDAQKVADEGVYLNQLLLDKGLVERFSL